MLWIKISSVLSFSLPLPRKLVFGDGGSTQDPFIAVRWVFRMAAASQHSLLAVQMPRLEIGKAEEGGTTACRCISGL